MSQLCKQPHVGYYRVLRSAVFEMNEWRSHVAALVNELSRCKPSRPGGSGLELNCRSSCAKLTTWESGSAFRFTPARIHSKASK